MTRGEGQETSSQLQPLKPGRGAFFIVIAGPLLRIGGNSADDTCFQQAGGAPLPPGGAGEETFNLSTLEAYRVFAASTAKLANVS